MAEDRHRVSLRRIKSFLRGTLQGDAKQANGAASDSSGSSSSSPVRSPVDESTIPRRLHSSGSVDLAVAIDVKNEAKVRS